MRRALTALFLVLHGAAALAGSEDRTFLLQGEYRSDAIDFEESSREYYRERATLRFSRESEFTAAHVRDARNGGSRFTWNLSLGDMPSGLSFMAGHFFAHFGKGMLAGKRSPFEPDVFSSRGAIHDGVVFVPCKSGNPYFAFHGVAASLKTGGEDYAISLHPFYSARERFITQDDYESRKTGSLQSLESRDGRTGTYMEPVRVYTRGAMLALSYLDHFSARAYCIDGGAASPNGDEISTGGLRNFNGRGFTLEYRDECLSVYYEKTRAVSRYEDQSGISSSSGGDAYLAGTSLALPFMRTSFIYKNTDDNYFSPYTATMGEYLGTGIFFDITLFPFKGMSMGASCSSERKANTGSRDEEQTVSERERVFITLAWRWLDEFRSELGISRRSEDGAGERRRWRQRMSLRPASFLSIGASVTSQSSEGTGNSRLGTLALGLHMGCSASLSVSCTRAFIAESNPVFESLLPLKNSSIPGTFIRDSGMIFAGRTTLSWQGLYFSARVFEQRTIDERRTTTVEFFASGTI